MDYKTVTIRMPRELFDTIEQLAKEDHRNITQQIIHLLEHGLTSIMVDKSMKE